MALGLEAKVFNIAFASHQDPSTTLHGLIRDR